MRSEVKIPKKLSLNIFYSSLINLILGISYLWGIFQVVSHKGIIQYFNIFTRAFNILACLYWLLKVHKCNVTKKTSDSKSIIKPLEAAAVKSGYLYYS